MNKIQITLTESAENLLQFVGLPDDDNILEQIDKASDEVLASTETTTTDEGIEINQKDTIRAVLNHFTTEQIVLLASKEIGRACISKRLKEMLTQC